MNQNKISTRTTKQTQLIAVAIIAASTLAATKQIIIAGGGYAGIQVALMLEYLTVKIRRYQQTHTLLNNMAE